MLLFPLKFLIIVVHTRQMLNTENFTLHTSYSFHSVFCSTGTGSILRMRISTKCTTMIRSSTRHKSKCLSWTWWWGVPLLNTLNSFLQKISILQYSSYYYNALYSNYNIWTVFIFFHPEPPPPQPFLKNFPFILKKLHILMVQVGPIRMRSTDTLAKDKTINFFTKPKCQKEESPLLEWVNIWQGIHHHPPPTTLKPKHSLI